MVKFLCFILTFTTENVKHDEMNFLYIAFMFYTAVADPKKLPTDHNSIFRCFTLKKKNQTQQFNKIRTDHFLLHRNPM